MNETRKMDEALEIEDRIREIFKSGTKEEVDLLVSSENNPEVSEVARKLIKKVRERFENDNPRGNGVTESGGYRVGRAPNLSEAEGDFE